MYSQCFKRLSSKYIVSKKKERYRIDLREWKQSSWILNSERLKLAKKTSVNTKYAKMLIFMIASCST